MIWALLTGLVLKQAFTHFYSNVTEVVGYTNPINWERGLLLQLYWRFISMYTIYKKTTARMGQSAEIEMDKKKYITHFYMYKIYYAGWFGRITIKVMIYPNFNKLL